MRIYLLKPPFLPRFLRCQRWQGRRRGIEARGDVTHFGAEDSLLRAAQRVGDPIGMGRLHYAQVLNPVGKGGVNAGAGEHTGCTLGYAGAQAVAAGVFL